MLKKNKNSNAMIKTMKEILQKSRLSKYDLIEMGILILIIAIMLLFLFLI